MWKPSFSRRKRVKHYDNGEPHFLTFSCYDRLPLLSKDRTRKWFVQALNDARNKHRFHLWAWIVMPEHVHLLIWPPASLIDPNPRSSKGKISGILSDIKRPVGRDAIQYLKGNAPHYLPRLTIHNRNRTYHRFWQAGSGYDENIGDVGALHEVVAYIHHNSVRRGLVPRAENWQWSSASDWLGVSADPVCPIDRTIPAVLEIPGTGRRSEF